MWGVRWSASDELLDVTRRMACFRRIGDEDGELLDSLAKLRVGMRICGGGERKPKRRFQSRSLQ